MGILNLTRQSLSTLLPNVAFAGRFASPIDPPGLSSPSTGTSPKAVRIFLPMSAPILEKSNSGIEKLPFAAPESTGLEPMSPWLLMSYCIARSRSVMPSARTICSAPILPSLYVVPAILVNLYKYLVDFFNYVVYNNVLFKVWSKQI